jgi:Rieske Fe-S protein
MDERIDGGSRRHFFTRIIGAVQTAIAGAVGVVAGGAMLSPGLAQREDQWLPAGRLTDLVDDAPLAVTVRVVREDGYRQFVERRIVFLVKTGDSVTALDSTCTHLGCRVSWDATAHELRCPCHGGVYDQTGAVKAGPPPSPLTRLSTRVDGSQVYVQV